MRKQQQVWLSEHLSQESLPSLANASPSSGVVLFVEWLRENHIMLSGSAIDIGCGKGRNSVYLASRDFEVWAVDYIVPAIVAAKQLAEAQQLEEKIHFINSEIDQPWQFEDDFFDLAIDSFSSIDIETRAGREMCRNEMLRTLKPGGYALVTVVSVEDEWEKLLVSESPGKEPNSVVWPQNGKFQKNYEENELQEFYADFDMIAFKKITKPALKLDKNYMATNFWMVLKKNKEWV